TRLEHDETTRPGLASAEPGPGDRLAGRFSQGDGEAHLIRGGQGRHLSDNDGARLLVEDPGCEGEY
ncbi:MAG: hypothetical protein HKM89_13060, partial [Gemmatimonadales bacterium]|nr:hypothetical protein [Gemmatimonadales bacterium]